MTTRLTYYYVQTQEPGKEPEIVPHSRDKKTKEWFYRFLDKSKAHELLKAEKLASSAKAKLFFSGSAQLIKWIR